MKKALSLLLRFLFAGILLYIVYRVTDVEQVVEKLKGSDYRMLFIGVVMFVIAIIINSYRWCIIVRTLTSGITMGSLFKITYIGAFFNNFMPGAVGGDIARVSLVIKEKTKRVLLASTIIADRFIGLGTIVVIGFIAVMFNITDVELYKLALPVSVIFMGFCLLVYFYFNEKFRGSRAGVLIKKVLPFKKIFYEADGAFKQLRTSGRNINSAILVSIVAQSFLVFSVYCATLSIRDVNVSVLYIFVVVPLIALLAAIPVSPGSLGVQEAGFVYFFTIVAVPEESATAVAILYRFIMVAATLPSVSILFLSGRKK